MPAAPQPTRGPVSTAVATPVPTPPRAVVPLPTTAQAAHVAPTPTAAQASNDQLAHLAAAVPEARNQIALVEAFHGLPETMATPTPIDTRVGSIERFWVLEPLTARNSEIMAELRYAGPIVLMYVDTSLSVDQQVLETAARTFESSIYPRTRTLFGAENSPGIDGEPRLTILNTNLLGAGGYFSPQDSLPRSVNRFSNQREMFVIALNSYPIGTEGYLATLAHEFQHMIDYTQQRRRPAWLGEALATLAEDLNGFPNQRSATIFLADPDLQLTTWAGHAARSGAHYGASRLFMRYVYEHYLDEAGLRRFVANDDDQLNLLSHTAAARRPALRSFADLYADWALANLLNDPTIDDGRYAYALLPARVRPTPAEPGEIATTVHQFGADYLGELAGPLTLDFSGATHVGLLPVTAAGGHYAWWSNRGDESVATLTRTFDLRNVAQATLEFDTWYEIERDYDYGFVSVSDDGGQRWVALPGLTTTSDDPQGQNLGHCLTGVSGEPAATTDDAIRGRWVSEQFDLSRYTGRIIQIRFWLVTDAAVNAAGWLIDNIRIAEIGYADDVDQGNGGWEASGFVRTTTILPQIWTLRLVRWSDDGVAIEPIPVDPQGNARINLAAGERGVLLISGATPFTTEPASYRYRVTQEGTNQ